MTDTLVVVHRVWGSGLGFGIFSAGCFLVIAALILAPWVRGDGAAPRPADPSALDSDAGPTWKCRRGWHRWTPWSEPRDGTRIFTLGGVDLGTRIQIQVQSRFCRDCNRKELKSND